MITTFLWIMKYVREEILEKFILPELGISYWDFCLYLAIAAIVITLLVNSIRVSGNASFASSVKEKNEKNYQNVLRERERVKADERLNIKKENSSQSQNYAAYDLDKFEEMLNR